MTTHACYRRGGLSFIGLIPGFIIFYVHGSITIALIVAGSLFGALILCTCISYCLKQRQEELESELARLRALQVAIREARLRAASQSQQPRPQAGGAAAAANADAPPPYTPPISSAEEAYGPPPAYSGSSVVHIHPPPNTQFSVNAGASTDAEATESTPLLRS